MQSLTEFYNISHKFTIVFTTEDAEDTELLKS